MFLKKPRNRGRPAKGEQREPAAEKRLDHQVRQSAEEAIKELPTICDRGTKKNAKGYKMSWNGYILHLETNDAGLPISALVTSASLHDNPVAIPLSKLASKKVTHLCDLMGAAYDGKRIEQASRELGHVPITDRNGRSQDVIPMAPHEAQRYKIRSGAEGANSRLKEDFGANNVMVKGHGKIFLLYCLLYRCLFNTCRICPPPSRKDRTEVFLNLEKHYILNLPQKREMLTLTP